MNKILLIITGSVAAYKALDLIRFLTKAGYKVTPVMTSGATKFITPLLVGSVSGSKVYCDLFDPESESKMGHIKLSRESDLIVIAPASADFIAKISNGLADDLASAILLAANKPIFIAPAMNNKMWENDITRSNIANLRSSGIKILEPNLDVLACGEYGIGKMTDPEIIFERINDFIDRKKVFLNKKIIITAGATFEAIDPVRFIGNNSSGKQGVAIAESLDELGAEVILIAANIKIPINLPKKNIIPVVSGLEMMSSVKDNLSGSSTFISAAAVADFRPKYFSDQKIKKSDQEFLNLELIKNVDILDTVSKSINRPKIVVGFAAETDNLLQNAQLKLKQKNCDLLIANDVDGGDIFGSDKSEVYLIDKSGKTENWGFISKLDTAQRLTEKLLELI